jgi:PKD repeat protein
MVANRTGVFRPELMISFGDPSIAAGVHGEFFYASLSISRNSAANGIELAVSNASLFSPSNACATPLGSPTTNSCWQATMVSANLTALAGSFEDKELLAVDWDSSSPYYGYVYVAWDHFKPNGMVESWVARCTPSLVCTMIAGGGAPPLSGNDQFPAFTTPAVGKDGAAHFTWCNYGTATDLGPIFCRARSTAPNGGAFGATSTIMSFEGVGTTLPAVNGILGLSTEQFRVASIGTVAVDTSVGSNDMYFAIAACTAGSYYNFRAPSLPGNCGAASIFFSRSTDSGATWSVPTIISQSGQNVMPWVTVDPSNGNIVIAYYTTQFDVFNHRIDVVASVSTDRGLTFGLVRLTNASNEPNADPGLFNYTSTFGQAYFAPQFGDYLQAVALGGQIWVLFNGNYASELGTLQLDPWLVTGAERTTLAVGARAVAATDVSASVAFTSTVTGGTPPFTYEWTFLDGNRSTDPRSNHAFALPGTYAVTLKVTDSTGVVARTTVMVTINPSLSATATVSNFNPAEGQSIDFAATVTGGTTPNTYHWAFGDGTTSDSATASHAFRALGTYTVRLWVNDSVGAPSKSSITVVVASANPGISTTAAASYSIVAFLIGLGIAIAVLTALARRREKVPPKPPEAGGPPPSG